MKSIKVMADYDSGPLWLVGGGNLSAYELPISDTLAGELWEWAGIFDDTLDRENPRLSGFETPEAERQFVDKGEELAKRLAVELGDGYSVSYYDSSLQKVRTISG